MNPKPSSTDVDVVKSALSDEGKTTSALVLLLYALDSIHRVELELRSDARLLDELRCLASVRSELMMALRVETGVGPFDSCDAVGVVEWMLGPTTSPCHGHITNTLFLAAQDIKRILPDV